MLWPAFRIQFLTAMVFTLIVAVVFISAGRVLVLALYRKLKRLPAPRRWRRLRKAVVVLAAIGAACLVYGHFVEPYWLEVTHVRIASPKLPAGSRPIRIVHISDLHCEARERLEGRLPRVIAGLNPDLIAFTGDAINSRPGLAVFRRCISRLALIAPTFAVQGNWDRWQGMTEGFNGTGAVELTGQVVKLEIAGATVYLVGAALGDWSKVEQALQTVPPSDFSIALYHRPDEIHGASAAGADLYLAGHTHGGQVALPLYGAMVTLSSHGKRFERGLHRVGKTYLYVNRGIGMEGGIVPRVRFLARPEITVIELAPLSR